MARSVIAYDKDLPEIPGRLPWVKPDAHLVKDVKLKPAGGWRLAAGKAACLLVPKIRAAVDAWREQATRVRPRSPDASSSTGSTKTMRWPASACRSATTSASARRSRRWSGWSRSPASVTRRDLIQAYAEVFKKDLFSDNIVFQTTMDGRRQIAATCRSWTRRACRTCRRKTCAASPSRWPPARARPG